MAAHFDQPGDATGATVEERVTLGERAWPVYNIAKIAGFVGIIGGVLVGYFVDPGFRRFYFAYLVSYCFFLSIALGSLGFVLLQFLTRAGWSVNVRRVAECLGATMPILAALSAPIVISVLIGNGALYRWAQPLSHTANALHAPEAPNGKELPSAEGASEARGLAGANQGPQGHPTTQGGTAGAEEGHGDAHMGHPSANGVPPLDELTLSKRAMLNPIFFTIRIILYFAIWTGMAMWYWRRSTEQDRVEDPTLTERMQQYSAPATLILALTMTFASFDLLMSLDPHWFSTMFGIYYMSGSLLAAFAALILVIGLLQRIGYLTQSVTTEHYHDLGKFLFAFVFFWGYIAFSQYMLLWYANIPEETGWLAHRGATTHGPDVSGWSLVSIALLFGQLLIPFAGLLSRHLKRNRGTLFFWAAWVLVFHWVDMYWLAMPELDGRVHFGVVEILCFIGIGGIFMATLLRLLAKNALRPVHDPRAVESLAFQNV